MLWASKKVGLRVRDGCWKGAELDQPATRASGSRTVALSGGSWGQGWLGWAGRDCQGASTASGVLCCVVLPTTGLAGGWGMRTVSKRNGHKRRTASSSTSCNWGSGRWFQLCVRGRDS